MTAAVCLLAVCGAGGPRPVRVGGVGAGPAGRLAPLRLVGVSGARQALPQGAREEAACSTGV
jgi:hypothetical protein